MEQLQQQIQVLQKQHEELRTLHKQYPTAEQVTALQQQLQPPPKQQSANAKVPAQGAESAEEERLGKLAHDMAVELTQRMKAAEESVAQLSKTSLSKAPEGLVPRSEMMRAFEALNTALTSRIKQVRALCAHNRVTPGSAFSRNAYSAQTCLQNVQRVRQL
jgi:hypothetical protein